MSSTRYVDIETVAARYGVKPNAIHKLTTRGGIPHLRHAGFRRLMFNPAHLDAWDAGAALVTINLPDGGRLVRPLDAGGDL